MATYLMLAQWTEEGIEHIEKSPERLDKAKEIARGLASIESRAPRSVQESAVVGVGNHHVADCCCAADDCPELGEHMVECE